MCEWSEMEAYELGALALKERNSCDAQMEWDTRRTQTEEWLGHRQEHAIQL